jgi:hypothetical protein
MSQLFTQGYALVVGVGADLPNTVSDAIGFGNILIDPERCAYPRSQVKLLPEGEANKTNILAELERLAQSPGTDASVIIYLSGHGYIVPTPTGPVYYLMANGYDLNRLDATAISNREFTEKLCAIRSQKLMVVLDCCHAGGMGEIGAKTAGLEMTKVPLPPDAAEVFTKGSGRVLLASSKASELSFAGKPYSVFTMALIEALSGNGAGKQDGYVRWLDLALYTRVAVAKRTRERQHPVADFSQSDNFEIAYYAAGGTQAKGLPFDQEPEIETEPGSGRFEPIPQVLVQAGHDMIGRDNIGGDKITIGNITGSTGIAVGEDAQAIVNQGASGADLDSLFAPLMVAAREAVPERRNKAIQKAEELRRELANGSRADDRRMAKLIEELALSVPSTVSPITAIFADRRLSGLAGGATGYVLENIRQSAK